MTGPARWLLLALPIALVGCGGEDVRSTAAEPPASAAPSSSEPERIGNEAAYLAELRAAGGLAGNYGDVELVGLGWEICDHLSAGGSDPLYGGRSLGDGRVEFESVSDPVWAMDMIAADFGARQHLCPEHAY